MQIVIISRMSQLISTSAPQIVFQRMNGHMWKAGKQIEKGGTLAGGLVRPRWRFLVRLRRATERVLGGTCWRHDGQERPGEL